MTCVARVVTDVTGIDKHFDYLVPDHLLSEVVVGCRVRVDLNARRVGGWIVGLESEPDPNLNPTDMSPIIAVSGNGVESDLVDLCRWVSQRWCGPLRAVLASASAPRVTEIRGTPQRKHSDTPSVDDVGLAATALAEAGGGLLVVPPLRPAVNALSAMAHRGPVLALCPTKRMAVLGAASLRRRGMTVALMPDDWARAAGGVDVVIGTRSAVWAPCPGVTSIVVIDSHDDSYIEERTPTWNAVDVARERARRAHIPCIETSSVPSLSSLLVCERVVSLPSSGADWPRIVIEDLRDQQLSGTQVGSVLISQLRNHSATVLSIINVKGRARLMSCRNCGNLALCPRCGRTVSLADDGTFECGVCSTRGPQVCSSCGRTDFRLIRRGTAQLRRELEAAAQREVVEVGVDTPADELDTARCYIGTEAALHRVTSADVVCLLDIDDEMLASRLFAVSDALSLIARAARVAGRDGTLIIQTREPGHPALKCFTEPRPSEMQEALLLMLKNELETRRSLSLPPSGVLAQIHGLASMPEAQLGVSVARVDDALVAVRADSWDVLADYVTGLRRTSGNKIRVRVNPSRM